MVVRNTCRTTEVTQKPLSAVFDRRKHRPNYNGECSSMRRRAAKRTSSEVRICGAHLRHRRRMTQEGWEAENGEI